MCGQRASRRPRRPRGRRTARRATPWSYGRYQATGRLRQRAGAPRRTAPVAYTRAWWARRRNTDVLRRAAPRERGDGAHRQILPGTVRRQSPAHMSRRTCGSSAMWPELDVRNARRVREGAVHYPLARVVLHVVTGVRRLGGRRLAWYCQSWKAPARQLVVRARAWPTAHAMACREAPRGTSRLRGPPPGPVAAKAPSHTSTRGEPAASGLTRSAGVVGKWLRDPMAPDDGRERVRPGAYARAMALLAAREHPFERPYAVRGRDCGPRDLARSPPSHPLEMARVVDMERSEHRERPSGTGCLSAPRPGRSWCRRRGTPPPHAEPAPSSTTCRRCPAAGQVLHVRGSLVGGVVPSARSPCAPSGCPRPTTCVYGPTDHAAVIWTTMTSAL